MRIANAWKHFMRILRHKHYVFKYMRKIGMPIRGLMHDMSKFHPIEFFESIKYYDPKESPINVCKRINGISYAWMHHKGRNPHHYEYWVDRLDDGCIPVQMPKHYAYEMICDFLGAGEAYNPKNWNYVNEYHWWMNRKKNNPKMAMHPKTQEFVTEVLWRLAHGNSFTKILLENAWKFTKQDEDIICS